MANIEELVGLIGDGNTKRGAAATAVGAAKAYADELAGELSAIGVDDRAGAVTELSRQLKEVQTVLAGLSDKLDEIQAGAQAAAGGLPTGGSAPTRASPAPTAPTKPTDHGPAPRPDMRKAAAIRPHVGIRKTVGLMTTADGAEIGGEIWSGREGPGKGGPGLASPWRHMQTMNEHVEGHAAAVMRRDGHRDAVLYLSRRPCEDDPYGCQRQLENALPAGARLTVFIVDRRGGIKPRKFIGNGRGLSNAD